MDTFKKALMKRNIEILFAATAASMLTLTALSQDSTTTRIGTDTHQEEVNRTSGHWSQGDRLHGAAKGSDVIGMQIKFATVGNVDNQLEVK